MHTGSAIPANALLDWPIVKRKMAWNVILLMGGGFALADACNVSILPVTLRILAIAKPSGPQFRVWCPMHESNVEGKGAQGALTLPAKAVEFHLGQNSLAESNQKDLQFESSWSLEVAFVHLTMYKSQDPNPVMPLVLWAF